MLPRFRLPSVALLFHSLRLWITNKSQDSVLFMWNLKSITLSKHHASSIASKPELWCVYEQNVWPPSVQRSRQRIDRRDTHRIRRDGKI